MRKHKLPQATIARFGSAKRRFASRKAFLACLKRLSLTGLKVKPDPVQIAAEGALWGSIAEQGLLDGTVIVSDGAGCTGRTAEPFGFATAKKTKSELFILTDSGHKYALREILTRLPRARRQWVRTCLG